MSPRVTIGLPVFNGEPFLADSIRSVLAQDYADFELIISDNASTDGTEEICRGFDREDTRVSYHRQPRNRGAAWNYNHLLDRARTPYFKWQAADDALRPSLLGRCVDVLNSQPDVVLCYAPAEYVGPDGAHRRFVYNPAGYAHGETASARIRSALSVTTHCFEVFGVIRTNELLKTRRIGAYPASDVVLLAELALLGQFHELDEPLFLHRMHRDRSVFKYQDKRDLVRWYTAGSGRLIAPRWRLLYEFALAFAHLPVSPADRMTAILGLVPWAARHRLQLAYDLAAALPSPVADRARAVRDRRRLARRGVKAADGGRR